tara:strand:+ start:18 stop:215 length:198 start_codon:yes stop_codon:yes gene_type:complete
LDTKFKIYHAQIIPNIYDKAYQVKAKLKPNISKEKTYGVKNSGNLKYILNLFAFPKIFFAYIFNG